MENYAALIEDVLDRRGWSHERGVLPPSGPVCLLLAAWEVIPMKLARDWLESIDDACIELFPDRVRLLNGGEFRAPAAQVSDHPVTTRSDLSLVLVNAQARLEKACSLTSSAAEGDS